MQLPTRNHIILDESDDVGPDLSYQQAGKLLLHTARRVSDGPPRLSQRSDRAVGHRGGNLDRAAAKHWWLEHKF